jgi:hypothetical protein
MANTETAARPAGRCPAAHPNDPTPCDGPAVVTVLDAVNAGADGCEHHGARLLATLQGGRVYRLPDAPEGAAIRAFKTAASVRPFPWLTNAPTPAPNLFSLAEDTRSERMLTMTAMDPATALLDLPDAARRAAVLLRQTATRAEAGQPIDPAELRAAAEQLHHVATIAAPVSGAALNIRPEPEPYRYDCGHYDRGDCEPDCHIL